MPYKADEGRRHKMPRALQDDQLAGDDRALQHRGSLTVWVTPEGLAAWHPPKTGRQGRSPQYADIAIETGHLLRLAFGLPPRPAEVAIGSQAVRHPETAFRGGFPGRCQAEVGLV